MGKKFAATVSAVGTARLFSLGAAAAQLPILTHYMQPDEYALVGSAIAIAVWVSLLTGDPYTLAFRRFPGTSDNLEPYSYTSTRVLLTLALLGSVAFGAAAVFGALQLVYGILGWAFGLASMRLVSMAWLMWDRPWRYSMTLIASTGSRTLLLVALVIGGQPATVALGTAGSVSLIVALVLGPRIGLRQFKGNSRPWPRGFGFSLALASLGTTLATNFDRALLPYLTDRLEAGQYVAMNQAANLSLGAVLGLMQLTLFPRVLYRWEKVSPESAQIFTSRVIHVSSLGSAVTIALFVVVGEPILNFVLGDGYYRAEYVLPLLGAAAVYGVAQQIAWSHQLALNARRLRRAGYLAGTLMVVFVLGAGPIWGAKGVAGVCIGAFTAYGVYLFRGSGLRASSVGQVLVLSVTGWLLLIPNDPIRLLVSFGALALVGLFAWTSLRSIRQRRFREWI